jgi:hypothetical protein
VVDQTQKSCATFLTVATDVSKGGQGEDDRSVGRMGAADDGQR